MVERVVRRPVAVVLLAACGLLVACGGQQQRVTGGGDSEDAADTSGEGATGGATPTQPGACKLDSECLVASASCCGLCGTATREDMVALTLAEAEARARHACSTTPCPACYQEPDPTLTVKCNTGHCEVVDLRQTNSAQ